MTDDSSKQGYSIPPSEDPIQATLKAAEEAQAAGMLLDAANLYQKIIDSQPNHLIANHQLASLLHNAMLHREAGKFWKTVVELEPDNFFTRINYAFCLHQSDQPAEALEQYKLAFEALREFRPELLPIQLDRLYFNLANVLDDLLPEDQTITALRKIIADNPMPEVTHSALAYQYSIHGDMEASRNEYRESLKISPNLALAHRGLAFAKKHTKLDEEVASMQALYNAGTSMPEDQMYLAFGLGKAFEDLQDYKTAFKFWEAGNKLHCQLYPYDIDQDVAHMRSIVAAIKPPLDMNQAANVRSGPAPIFIVSMPRAGSSLTEQILACHSAIYAAGEITALSNVCRKNATGFPAGLPNLNKSDWEKLAAEYTKVASRGISPTETFFTDKTPTNFTLLGAIRMMFPNAKVINCAREPGDVALSCYKNDFAPGAAMYTYDLEALGKMYRCYEETVNHWQDTLPDFVHTLQYEKLVANPEEEIRRLLDFLDLPFDQACLDFHKNTRRTITASAAQVREPIHNRSVEKWKFLAEELRPFEIARQGTGT